MEHRAIIEASSIDVLRNKRRPGRSCVKRSDIQTARIECFGPGPFLPNPDEMRFSTRSRTNEYLRRLLPIRPSVDHADRREVALANEKVLHA
jgi:hypothetical protein